MEGPPAYGRRKEILMMTPNQPPYPGPEAGQAALKALLKERSLLPALSALHSELGPVFKLSAPGFQPVMMAGPQANHFVLIEARQALLWRPEGDPVSRLLRNGLLMLDGEEHAQMRRLMMPPLQRRKVSGYIDKMLFWIDQVCDTWQEGKKLDMLVEMRRAALLILMDALFEIDFSKDIDKLWKGILGLLNYISPGLWLVWKEAPRLGGEKAIRELDQYLYSKIAERRSASERKEDLLSLLVANPDLDDSIIRDQMLTMLIAGHDTSTALLAWTLFLLGKHPQVLQKTQQEVDNVLGGARPDSESVENLVYLGQVISETLRIYPPIHIGNRKTAQDLDFQEYTIPAGERLMYSIYATHHAEEHWPDPEKFDPERFAVGKKPEPYTYLPFGGGPRNCIGAAFAQVEAKVVLARILQRFELILIRHEVRQHMGATLEPRPGVFMKVRPRQ
jgi:cytochrome P450